MLRSILIGLVAGQRAMTPLAVIAGAIQQGTLQPRSEAERLFRHPAFAWGAVALAAGEMAGDKMRSAPDRTVAVGLLARSLTAAFAGAALAPPGRRQAGAVAAVATALGASFVGLALRRSAMETYGQVPTGFVEDALVLTAGSAAVNLRRADR